MKIAVAIHAARVSRGKLQLGSLKKDQGGRIVIETPVCTGQRKKDVDLEPVGAHVDRALLQFKKTRGNYSFLSVGVGLPRQLTTCGVLGDRG